MALALALAVGAAPAVADDTLVNIVARAKPSVVAVGTYDELSSPRFTFRGTGFVVGNGLQIVTNHHVIQTEVGSTPRFMVWLPRTDGQPPEQRLATLQARDSARDLALLTVQGTPLPPLPLAADTPARDGQSVALIGFPLGAALGLTPVTHRGIVAAVTQVALPPANSRQLDARTLNQLRQGAFSIYQLDATAYPGNSGSPLLDAHSGAVLGIVNMVFVKGTKESVLSAPSGISYAIPARHIVDLLQQP